MENLYTDNAYPAITGFTLTRTRAQGCGADSAPPTSASTKLNFVYDSDIDSNSDSDSVLDRTSVSAPRRQAIRPSRTQQVAVDSEKLLKFIRIDRLHFEEHTYTQTDTHTQIDNYSF